MTLYGLLLESFGSGTFLMLYLANRSLGALVIGAGLGLHIMSQVGVF